MRSTRQRNTAIAIAIGLALLLVGAGITWIGTTGDEWYHFALMQIGTAVMISVALAGLWEWRGKRLLADEIHEKMRIDLDVERWGLQELSLEWDDQRWVDLFNKGPNVDILLGYGRTWRNMAARGLEAFMNKKGNTLRICLPDPNEDWLMVALARRYNTSAEAVRDRIHETTRYFADHRTNGQARIQIFYRAGEPMYGLYRFESVALVTVYPHRKERSTEIPALMVEDGDLLNFVRKDFEAARSSPWKWCNG